MIGVLIHAQVSHQHDPITNRGAQLAESDLDDPIAIARPRSDRVLMGRNSEEHHRADTEIGELAHLGHERVDGVLHHSGKRRDRLGPVDALAHEERRDEVGGVEPGLGDEVAHRGCPAEATGTVLGEAALTHGRMVRPRGPGGHLDAKRAD